MTRHLLLLLLWITLSSAAASAGTAAAAPAPATRRAPKYKSGELLVRFRGGASESAKAAAHARVGAAVVRNFHIVAGLQHIRLPQGMSVTRAIQVYRRNPAVLYAEPNFIRHATTTPNDPKYASQWDLNNTGQGGGTPHADIDAPEAWALTTGSSNVVVGVIDTGVDYNHPDLSGNMHQIESSCSDGFDNDGNGYVDDCYGINPVYGNSDPADDYGHGTHVAGTIGATGNNGLGVAGINWNVGIVACKFLDSTGSGTDADAVTCLEYLKDLKDNHGLNLVATNNSWGGGGYSQALYDAIDAHRQSGILFVAAAGNSSADNDVGDFFPANYYLPNVISVAATDRNDALANFSDYGKHTVHLGAPGVGILSTALTSGPLSDPSGYMQLSGTSMATPHVTAVAALLKAQDPSRDWRAIRNLILAGGDDKASLTSTVTGKRLNAHGSLACSNATVLARVLPVGPTASAIAGTPTPIGVLHIDCADAAGDITVTINPGGYVVTLHDDGATPDQAAGDGIYSGNFTPPAPGTYTVSITGGDSFTLSVLAPYYYQPVANSPRTLSNPTELFFYDDDVTQITPSFPIPFGEGSFPSLYVSNNGVVSFDTSAISYVNPALPTNEGATFVAPFWTDLETYSTGGDVFWEEQGSAPNRELIIEFRDEGLTQWCDPYYGCAGSNGGVTFQEIFFESKSDVLFNYNDATFGSDAAWADYGASATIGVQVANAPGGANQFSFNQPSVDDNTALLWTTTGPNITAPVPAIATLSPSTTTNPADFVLTVNGSNFVSGSVVRWDGSDRPTTYVNGGQLTAQISAADLGLGGPHSVTVFTLAGGTSNGATFTVVEPAPTITSISPDAAVSGNFFTLTVTGTNFVGNSVIQWNGAQQTTTFVDTNHLTAGIGSNQITAAGTYDVTVYTPGGGTSNAATFTVSGPTISSISPSSGQAGGPAFTLTVNGTNFDSTSVVRFSGVPRSTTLVNPSQLTAYIQPTDIAGPGTVNVDVVNAGGITSSTAAFTIIAPVVTSISPTGMGVGGSALTLTVTGANFDNQSVVRWSGSPRPTTFVDGNHVTAAITSSDLTVATVQNVTVANAYGYVSSPDVQFAVTDFAAQIDPGSISVTGGQQAVYTVYVMRWGNPFNDPIQLSCSVPSSLGTCTVSQSTVDPGSSNVQMTVTVNTNQLSAATTPTTNWPVFAFALLMPLAVVASVGRRRRGILLGLVLFGVFLMASCGGGGGASQSTPRPQVLHTGTVTFTATSGTVPRSASATLTVN